MSTFRLAHLSDPHLTPPQAPFRWSDLVSKRTLSRFAWKRKKHRRHWPQVLAALADDIRAAAPDHVAVTGDLTNFSTPEEFAAAADWLRALGAPEDVTVSPGNHDALVARGSSDRFEAWRPWLGEDAGWPKVRVRGPVAIINLCSATPTAIHSAEGELGSAQIAGLDRALADAAAEGLCRVLLVHHPVAPGVVSDRKALRDAPALREVLAARGAELVLHGHTHEALLTAVPGPAGAIPVLSAPSASTPAGLKDDPAQWRLIEIRQAGAGFEISVQAREVGPDLAITPLGGYALAS